MPGVIDAVVVVIEKDGRYLMGFRGGVPMKGLWGQLGGKVDFGESVAEAAIREVREESGLTIHKLKFLFQMNAHLSENGKDYRIFVVQAVEFEGEASVTEPEKTPIVGWIHGSLIPAELTSASREYFERAKILPRR